MLAYLMHGGVVGPGQHDDPWPGLAVDLGLDGGHLVAVGARRGRQVRPLLQPVQRVRGRAQPQLRVLVKRRGCNGRRRQVVIIVRTLNTFDTS